MKTSSAQQFASRTRCTSRTSQYGRRGCGLALGVRIFRGLASRVVDDRRPPVPHRNLGEAQPVPDVSSNAPADVRLWVALDVHKFSIVAATLPPTGGTPQLQRVETTERAIRRLI